jgi:hypothetical protein
MRNSTIVSWLAQVALGFLLFVGGFEVARIFWGTWEVVGASTFVSLVGLCLMVHAEIRRRPLRVLRKARRGLSFPTQWAVKFDKRVPQGGVIPVAVIRSDGVRFVIDIQGLSEAAWNPVRGGCPLIGPRGKKFKNDPVAPLMQAAAGWGATPVLWLPEARQLLNLRQDSCNLIVVMGGARELQHVLRGAEIVPARPDSVLEMTMPPPLRRSSGSSRGRSNSERKTPPVGSPELV